MTDDELRQKVIEKLEYRLGAGRYASLGLKDFEEYHIADEVLRIVRAALNESERRESVAMLGDELDPAEANDIIRAALEENDG